MGKILRKPFKHWRPGTVLTSETRMIKDHAHPWPTGAILVSAERMAQLEREGYFDVH